MDKHIPADELKNKFIALGHFYTLKYSNYQTVNCRSDLEIINRSLLVDNAKRLLEENVEAIFVMMNPGGSKPIIEQENVVSVSGIQSMEASLTEARPDPTIYQVMRVMLHKNWNHIRILNLSDIISSKSDSFFYKWEKFKKLEQSDIHSVFFPTRSEELTHKLNLKNDKPIILAWGVDENIASLIKLAQNHLMGLKNVIGFSKFGSNNKFYHPLPPNLHKQIEWVDKVLNIIGNNN